MFTRVPVEKDGLEKTLDDLFNSMNNETPDSPEYARMADQLVKIYPLKEVDAKAKATRKVSPDTWATVIANLIGIGMIVGHERANVVTSKALAFVAKLR